MASKKLNELEKRMLQAERNHNEAVKDYLNTPSQTYHHIMNKNANERKVATVEYWDAYQKYVDRKHRAMKGWAKRKKWVYKKD
jgi:hypothetical protein